jgi:exonuclease VII large subunit
MVLLSLIFRLPCCHLISGRSAKDDGHSFRASCGLKFRDADSARELHTQPQVISVPLNRIANPAEQRACRSWVAGEISNCSAMNRSLLFHAADAAAQVDCVMFRKWAQLLGWLPQDVEVRSRPHVDEARGSSSSPSKPCAGPVWALVRGLREAESQAGAWPVRLERRRPLPRFPVGSVRDPQAAALRDVDHPQAPDA